MGWNVIRKATEDDYQALQLAARRFCKRHDINVIPEFTVLDAVNHEIEFREHQGDHYLNNLWKRIVRRTLGHKSADGIAYGYVGYSMD